MRPRAGGFDEFEIGDDAGGGEDLGAPPGSGRSGGSPQRAAGPARWVAGGLALIGVGILIVPATLPRVGSSMTLPVLELSPPPIENHILAAPLAGPITPAWTIDLNLNPDDALNLYVVGDRVILGSDVATAELGHGVYRAYDAATGALVWEFTKHEQECAEPGESILCTSGAPGNLTLTRIDVATGNVTTMSAAGAIAFAEVDGDLFALREDATGISVIRHTAFDLDGPQRWRRHVPDSVGIDLEGYARLAIETYGRLEPGESSELLALGTIATTLLFDPGSGAIVGELSPEAFAYPRVEPWVDDDPQGDLTFVTQGSSLVAGSGIGQPTWRVAGQPTLVARLAGRAVVASESGVTGYAARLGSATWQRPDLRISPTGCYGFAGTLLCPAHVTMQGEFIVALDVASGETQWSVPVPGNVLFTTAEAGQLAFLTDEGIALFHIPGGG